MSDLAPFVAAVIRDCVVVELKDENEALRQENEALKLEGHKQNPRRSVKVTRTGSNGKDICADNDLNLEVLRRNQSWLRISLFGPAPVRPGIPDPLWFECGSWLSLELWIDGGPSIRLQDLSFITNHTDKSRLARGMVMMYGSMWQ